MWGTSGTIYFAEKVPKNYKEFVRIDQRPWYTYFLDMLAHGIIPMADYDEQWTISIQHTEEDITRHLETAQIVLKKLKEDYKL